MRSVGTEPLVEEIPIEGIHRNMSLPPMLLIDNRRPGFPGLRGIKDAELAAMRSLSDSHPGSEKQGNDTKTNTPSGYEHILAAKGPVALRSRAESDEPPPTL